jgi:hypothetical protein
MAFFYRKMQRADSIEGEVTRPGHLAGSWACLGRCGWAGTPR